MCWRSALQSSSDMMRPRPMTDPRLPHSRSTGWVFFSRLGCPMSSKGWSKGLGCVSSFLWYFAYFSNMTSRTYGTFTSSCRVKLDTYRGALVIMCRIFDCAFCSIAWFYLLAQPQISIPYVQIGFIIVLYIKSLFSVDSCDFLPTQNIRTSLSSICGNLCLKILMHHAMTKCKAGNQLRLSVALQAMLI